MSEGGETETVLAGRAGQVSMVGTTWQDQEYKLMSGTPIFGWEISPVRGAKQIRYRFVGSQ